MAVLQVMKPPSADHMQNTTQDTLLNKLSLAMADLGVPGSVYQQNQLLQYLEQLTRWNTTYNLTAIRETDQMLSHHIYDSLSVVPCVQKKLMLNNRFQNNCIADIGSGAGLPGIVLAVMMPDIKITCVDAVEKKTTFIKQMAGILKLSNLSVNHARAEKLETLQADIVISRAFASLQDFILTAQHHVKASGYFAAMKGKIPNDELAEITGAHNWQETEIESLNVPELNAQRCIVWLQRIKK